MAEIATQFPKTTKILDTFELFERNKMKFLVSQNTPKIGYNCRGVEIAENGFKREIETDVVQEVKEISGKKYIAITSICTYLVDVI